MPTRPISRIHLIGALLPAAILAQPPAAKHKTVWDGIFNQVEVSRGTAAYASYCSRCHAEDLRGLGGVLIGGKFMDRWREDNLRNLFQMIRDTMPPGPRDRLTEAEYVDILAYVLKMNEFPEGSGELAPDEFGRILIVAKTGPQPVPDFSLVTVVGCLSRDAANKWMLTGASEPVRTRTPRQSTDAELDAAKVRPGGDHTFHFLDTYEFTEEFKAGRWMEAKGFLIRAPGNDRINLTWLKGLRESCSARKD